MKLKKWITTALVSLTLLMPHAGKTQTINELISPSTEKELKISTPNRSKDTELQIFSRTSDQECASQKPKYATLEQEVNLYAVLKTKRQGKRVYVSLARCLDIDGKKIYPESTIPPGENPTWFKVEPQKMRYSYVSSRSPIKYFEQPFAQGWEIKAEVHPTLSIKDQFSDSLTGLGVMRYKVNLGPKLNTPGKESVENGTISEKVHKVSFRPNTGSWTDYLFEMFNTPYIYGSSPSQVDNQKGSDCADLVVYALKRAGIPIEYTWSLGLTNNHQLFERINRSAPLKQGDLFIYQQHVAVWYKDNPSSNRNLDESLLIHTYRQEPQVIPLYSIGLPNKILRLK